MSVKRYLGFLIQRLYLNLKKLRINFFIPIVIADVFLPIICCMTYKSETANIMFDQTVMEFSMVIIPLCSVWWAVFINRDYVEGMGNELLFVCKSKIKLIDTFLSYLLFFAVTITQFALYINWEEALKSEPLKLLIISFFYYCAVQFFAFLTQSIAITLFVVLCYTIINVISSASAEIIFFPLYFDTSPLSAETFLYQYLPMLIVSLLLLGASIYINKKRLKFN